MTPIRLVGPVVDLDPGIWERCRRTTGVWVPPPSMVLRPLVRLDAPHTTVQLAAPVRVMLHTTVQPDAAEGSAREQPRVVTAVPRLLARGTRVEPTWPGRREPASMAAPSSPAAPAGRVAPPPMVRPARMVLTRPAGVAADGGQNRRLPVSRPHVDAESVAATTRMRAAASSIGLALDEGEVTRLTDRVVAAIDRRMLASRERMQA